MEAYLSRQKKCVISLFLVFAVLCSVVSMGLSKSAAFRSSVQGQSISEVNEDLIPAAVSPDKTVSSEREQVAREASSQESCMQKRLGNSLYAFAGILLIMAEILFVYTCTLFLLFSNDRIRRFCLVRYIHRSDGKKSHNIIFA